MTGDPSDDDAPPGPLLAAGRAADVHDLGDGTVLRRYRTDHDAEPEGRLMAWLASSGIRVPQLRSANGRDLVMERIDGPTMLDDLQRRPWRLRQHVQTLASLQRSINELPAPEWLSAAPGVPDGDRVVHGDLHPMNVLLAEDGPVVIDFSNSGRGSAAFDAALSYVLMSTFETSGPVDRVAQAVIVRAFRRARGRALVDAGMNDACRYRLADANITPGERARVSALMSRGSVAGDRPDRSVTT